LFKTPEQTVPPRVLSRANELANAPHPPVTCPLHELRHDAGLREAHLNNLSGQRPRKRGEIDPHLAIARAKIEDAETIEEAAGYLSRRETFAVLNAPAILAALLALPTRPERPAASQRAI
jgi:membrane glycosyltransferase